MRLYLPDVTVVAIDTVAHDLTRMAIEDTLGLIEPAETIVFSDDQRAATKLGCCRFELIPTCRSLGDVANVLWYQVPFLVKTSHFLVLQWDGWVVDPTMWSNEFLEYDYIGAPWPWHSGLCVGNGGFSLRSVHLARYMADQLQNRSKDDVLSRTVLQLLGIAEDNLLCRFFRPQLEVSGFHWAPDDVAKRFSLEHGEVRKSFGFHDVNNFMRLLSTKQVRDRVNGAIGNEYLAAKPVWQPIVAMAQGRLTVAEYERARQKMYRTFVEPA